MTKLFVHMQKAIIILGRNMFRDFNIISIMYFFIINIINFVQINGSHEKVCIFYYLSSVRQIFFLYLSCFFFFSREGSNFLSKK